MNNNALGYAQLMFNVDVPDLEETYLDGYQSGKQEVSEDQNPYAMGTAEYEYWNEGWWDGFYQKEPLFDLAGQINEKATQETAKQIADETKVVTSKQSKKYIVRTIQILGALLAGVFCYQLADILMV